MRSRDAFHKLSPSSAACSRKKRPPVLLQDCQPESEWRKKIRAARDPPRPKIYTPFLRFANPFCGPDPVAPDLREAWKVVVCGRVLKDKKTRSLGLRPPRRYPSGQSVSLPFTSVDEPQVDLRLAKSRLRRPTAPSRAKLEVTLSSSQTKFAMSQQMSAPGLTPKSPSALLKPLKTFKDVVAGKKRPPRVLRAGTEYP